MHPRSRRIAGRTAVAVVAAAGALAITVNVTPRPVTRVIKFLFERGGAALAARMSPHVPTGVQSEFDVPYTPGGPTPVLNVHRAGSAAGPRPVLVWIHGGAWVSGSNADVDHYLEIVAARTAAAGEGVVAVAVDYTQGPIATYPSAIVQINDALVHLGTHAAELGLDMGRLVLAGDSAGAQLASQLAGMVTNPVLAARVGIVPAVSARQVRGVILHCGVYDLTGFAGAPGPVKWAFGQVIWAYTGARGIRDNAALVEMSSLRWVTPDFPPTLIAGGNADPLTNVQSRPFAAVLAQQQVALETHFYDDDHQPPLGHEFQFDLDGADGRRVLDRTIAFLAERFAD